MATKGVAISQIILLVLGIIVLAVVAFLLISNFASSTGQIDAQKCRTDAINACTSCSIATGSTTNCVASAYLRSDFDKQCIYNNFIIGPDTPNPTSVKKDPSGKITDYGDITGNINCANYIGGLSGGSASSVCPASKPKTSTNAKDCEIGGTGLGTIGTDSKTCCIA